MTILISPCTLWLQLTTVWPAAVRKLTLAMHAGKSFPTLALVSLAPGRHTNTAILARIGFTIIG